MFVYTSGWFSTKPVKPTRMMTHLALKVSLCPSTQWWGRRLTILVSMLRGFTYPYDVLLVCRGQRRRNVVLLLARPVCELGPRAADRKSKEELGFLRAIIYNTLKQPNVCSLGPTTHPVHTGPPHPDFVFKRIKRIGVSLFLVGCHIHTPLMFRLTYNCSSPIVPARTSAVIIHRLRAKRSTSSRHHRKCVFGWWMDGKGGGNWAER